MKIIPDKKLDFSDVLICPRPTELKSRSEVNLEISYFCKHSRARIVGIPVIVANMSCVATINMATTLAKHKMFVALHKFIPVDDLIKFFNTEDSKYSFMTIGSSDDDLNKLIHIAKHSSNLNKINLDVANGYMQSFLDRIKVVRELFKDCLIMAGNVATPEGLENIISAGADISKVGIAGGNFCDTKFKAGVGYKQFSAASECGQAARELKALCCSDGGCKTSADICKALGSGSHFAMCGSMFAGYDQCDSEWREENGKKQMLMYGMSSKYANDKFAGGLKDYRASEGKEGWVNYKGDVNDLCLDIKGSLASCCTYTNTKNLENLSKNCIFTT